MNVFSAVHRAWADVVIHTDLIVRAKHSMTSAVEDSLISILVGRIVMPVFPSAFRGAVQDQGGTGFDQRPSCSSRTRITDLCRRSRRSTSGSIFAPISRRRPNAKQSPLFANRTPVRNETGGLPNRLSVPSPRQPFIRRQP
jgi:hypothetical protein